MNDCLTTYQKLCTEVYDLSKPQPPQDEYAFYRSYLMEANGPVLEPMCGTGRFLLPLAAEGFDLHGFDASDAMLKALRTKAHAQNLNPHVWKDFIEAFDTSTLYPLIFIPSGSFCLITDLSAIQSMLEKFYKHLHKEGVLVFEVETEKSLPAPLDVWCTSTYPKPDGTTIELSKYTSVAGNICISRHQYTLMQNDTVLHTETEDMQIRLYNDPKELLTLLNKVGFHNIKMIKPFDRKNLATEKDATIVYECRK